MHGKVPCDPTPRIVQYWTQKTVYSSAVLSVSEEECAEKYLMTPTQYTPTSMLWPRRLTLEQEKDEEQNAATPAHFLYNQNRFTKPEGNAPAPSCIHCLLLRAAPSSVSADIGTILFSVDDILTCSVFITVSAYFPAFCVCLCKNADEGHSNHKAETKKIYVWKLFVKSKICL